MATASSNPQNKYPQVTIPGLGTVQGVVDTDSPVAKFLNIPFGVVHERWRAASKAGPWQGVRDATKNGYNPPQITKSNPFMSLFFGIPLEAAYEEAMSERDCLSCNIFMPTSALASEEELPVLVWIYGGGLKFGGITMPIYDCSELVMASIELEKPVIVVTINYRLNYFGFISSRELVLDAQEYSKNITEDDRRWYDGSVGNWGLTDLILGLEWIRDHVRAFSGNPKRVTVMGQSGGAVAISYLQLIPECHGLFHRSIIQSGSAATLPTMRPEIEGQRYFDHLCKVFGVPSELPPLEKVTRLRAVPEKQLAEELNSSPVFMFSPTLDGVVFKEDSRLTLGTA
ncbi:hypothetical protein BGX28_003057 [Mortierella sp. GBA30]|nr:hypothetical protein BGX28_003057 [Mortierella sp. GBA30]